MFIGQKALCIESEGAVTEYARLEVIKPRRAKYLVSAVDEFATNIAVPHGGSDGCRGVVEPEGLLPYGIQVRAVC